MPGISSTGVSLDPIATASTADIVSAHGSSLAANTWYNVPNMDNRADFTNGLYLLKIYASLYSGGASLYQAMATTEVITWHNYQQNDNGLSDVVMQGNWMGHAVNISEDPNAFIKFGVDKQYGSFGGSGGLMFYPYYALSLDAANGGKHLTMHMYKVQ